MCHPYIFTSEATEDVSGERARQVVVAARDRALCYENYVKTILKLLLISNLAVLCANKYHFSLAFGFYFQFLLFVFCLVRVW